MGKVNMPGNLFRITVLSAKDIKKYNNLVKIFKDNFADLKQDNKNSEALNVTIAQLKDIVEDHDNFPPQEASSSFIISRDVKEKQQLKNSEETLKILENGIATLQKFKDENPTTRTRPIIKEAIEEPSAKLSSENITRKRPIAEGDLFDKNFNPRQRSGVPHTRTDLKVPPPPPPLQRTESSDIPPPPPPPEIETSAINVKKEIPLPARPTTPRHIQTSPKASKTSATLPLPPRPTMPPPRSITPPARPTTPPLPPSPINKAATKPSVPPVVRAIRVAPIAPTLSTTSTIPMAPTAPVTPIAPKTDSKPADNNVKQQPSLIDQIKTQKLKKVNQNANVNKPIPEPDIQNNPNATLSSLLRGAMQRRRGNIEDDKAFDESFKNKEKPTKSSENQANSNQNIAKPTVANTSPIVKSPTINAAPKTTVISPKTPDPNAKPLVPEAPGDVPELPPVYGSKRPPKISTTAIQSSKQQFSPTGVPGTSSKTASSAASTVKTNSPSTSKSTPNSAKTPVTPLWQLNQNLIPKKNVNQTSNPDAEWDDEPSKPKR